MFNLILHQQLNEARDRCYMVANSERLLGYEETSVVYKSMAEEFTGLCNWVDYYEMELQQAEARSSRTS